MQASSSRVEKGLDINGLKQKLTDVLKDPQEFLCAQPKRHKSLGQLLLDFYQLALKCDPEEVESTFMSELILEDMMDEQIWQQLELRNKVVLPRLAHSSDKMLNVPSKMFEIELEANSSEEEEDNDIHPFGSDDSLQGGNNSGSDGEKYVKEELKPKQRKMKPSELDDGFFNLGEMEAYLLEQETKEMRKEMNKNSVEDEDGIDFFSKLEDDEDESDGPEYKDFFENESNEVASNRETESLNGVQEKKKVHFAEEEKVDEVGNDEQMSDYNENNDGTTVEQKQSEFANNSKQLDDYKNEEEGPKSSFEMLQNRIQHRIEEYENDLLSEKPWQLKGEIKGTSRPQHSLLEEVVEFESTTRPAPVITDEANRRLEDIIRQHIKNCAWDDVELKTKPIHSSNEKHRELVLDQEKSKQSLAKIYEEEYKNELGKLDPNQTSKEQSIPKEHQEIETLMRDVFAKLDALFNYNFIPKPVVPEPRIITNTPAINMEEVAPVAVSNAKMLAPHELRKRQNYPPIGESERTKTDKNRERRKKKQKQRAEFKAREMRDSQKQKMGKTVSKNGVNSEALKKVTKNRNVKEVCASKDYGSLKSSKSFFSQLQDKATVTTPAVKKSDTRTMTAKKLKL